MGTASLAIRAAAPASLDAFVCLPEHLFAIDNLAGLGLKPAALNLLTPLQADFLVLVHSEVHRVTA